MALWENVIGYGTRANRPAPGAPGALYCESDTGRILRDNGTTWDELALTARRDTIIAAEDVVLERANVIVFVTGSGISVTLPDPAANIGLEVRVKGVQATPPEGPYGSYTVKNPDASNADGFDKDGWTGYSTGTKWWWTDY